LATINIANLTFTHKGDYDGSTAYVKNDVVYYSTNGNAYIAKQNTTGNAPTNGTYWSQFAAGSGGIWNAGLSLGTAGQSVKVNAAGNALEFGTISSDYVYLGGASTSNTSDLHVDLFSADYDIYEVFIHNWYGSAAGNGTQLQFNTAANTPQTGSNYRHIFDGHYWNNSDGNNNQRTGDWDDSNIAISNLGGASDANAYRLTFINPFSSSYRTTVISTGGGHETNHIYSRHGQGYYNVAQQHTGFTLFASSGNIYIDYLKVYGLKTS
jgi:hypothetical protein